MVNLQLPMASSSEAEAREREVSQYSLLRRYSGVVLAAEREKEPGLLG